MKEWHYFEAHVTLEPTSRLEELKQLVSGYGFRVADLYYDKGGQLLPAEIDHFTSSRGKSVDELCERTKELVVALLTNDFYVKRYKIEDVVIDSRHEDSFNLFHMIGGE